MAVSNDIEPTILYKTALPLVKRDELVESFRENFFGAEEQLDSHQTEIIQKLARNDDAISLLKDYGNTLDRKFERNKQVRVHYADRREDKSINDGQKLMQTGDVSCTLGSLHHASPFSKR